MKIAIIGSRNIEEIDILKYIINDVTEVVSGGAKGVDKLAQEYANKYGIEFKEFIPNYNRFGKGAPIKRNQEIVDYVDFILAFWDGKSRGTKSTIEYCKKVKKPCKVVLCNEFEVNE